MNLLHNPFWGGKWLITPFRRREKADGDSERTRGNSKRERTSKQLLPRLGKHQDNGRSYKTQKQGGDKREKGKK